MKIFPTEHEFVVSLSRFSAHSYKNEWYDGARKLSAIWKFILDNVVFDYLARQIK